MREFGWTIEYTLALTYPVFFELFSLISRVRADAAIEGVYAPYAAAKYGGEARKRLFSDRGGFYLDDTKKVAPKSVSKRAVAEAVEKLKRINEARARALAHTAQC